MTTSQWNAEQTLTHPLPVTEVLWSPAGDMIVATCRSTMKGEMDEPLGTCFVWSVDSGACVFSFPERPVDPVWSPDGRFIAHPYEGGRALVRDSHTGDVLLEVDADDHRHPSGSLVWHPSSEQIAVYWYSTSGHGKLPSGWQIWDVENRIVVSEFEEEFHGWNPTGTHFVTKSDGCFVCWDAATCEPVTSVEGDDFEGWSPNGRHVVTSSFADEPEAMLWDMSTGECLVRTWLDMRSCIWADDSTRVMVKGRNPRRPESRFVYLLWNAQDGEILFEQHSHYPEVIPGSYFVAGGDASFSPDGTKFSCDECWCHFEGDDSAETNGGENEVSDDRVHVYDLETGLEMHRFPHSNDLTWSPDGLLMATCLATEDGHCIVVRDASSGEVVWRIAGSSYQRWSPDDRLVAFAGVDGTVIDIWDPWAGRRLGSVPVIADRDRPLGWGDVVWSPDGGSVAVAVGGGDIALWSLRQGGQ